MNTYDRDYLDRICHSQMHISDYGSFKIPPITDLNTVMYPGHYIVPNISMIRKPVIKKVIFNDPATIVIWDDETKTVVKCCEGDEFDPEKGLAMAISKKVLGGSLKEVKKWTDEYYKKQEEISSLLYKMAEAFRKIP